MPDAPAGGGGGNFLAKKWGPFPVWVYAVGGGALLVLIALYRKGGTSMTAPSAQQSSPYASDSSGILNYPPTVVVTPAGTQGYQGPVTQPSGSTSASPPGVGSVVRVGSSPYMKGPDGSSGTVLRLTAASNWGQTGTWVREGQPITITGAPQQVKLGDGTLTPLVPVNYLGGSYFVALGDIAGGSGGGGMGGGWGARGPAGPMSGALRTQMPRGLGGVGHFVPFQPQQFVASGRGGADGAAAGDGMGEGMGGRAMSAIAKKTGIPLVRLKSLNYHLRTSTGAYGPGHVRVA